MTFLPGETAKTVSVTVNGDSTFEPNETLRIVLSNAANATIGAPGFGVETILNDDAAPAGFQIATASLSNGRVGTSYTTTLTTSGGTAPYTWKKINRLPKGLKLGANTGVISGTPKVAGTFAITVQASYKTKALRQPTVKHLATKTFTFVVT